MINEHGQHVLSLFQEELLSGVRVLSSGNWQEAYTETRRLVTKWLSDFIGIEPNERVLSFFGDQFVQHFGAQIAQDEEDEDIPITIGTVHSVKGCTHCATMYVETSYKNKYECEYLIDDKVVGRGHNRVRTITGPFFKQDMETERKIAAMAKRMLYVGFSRPTHLLCYASDKSLWSEERLRLMHDAGWEIVSV